ncbi:FAT domain-containing protein, partial [Hamiltosporidium magnivora]
IQELGNYTGDFGLITESSWRLSNFEIESDRSSFFNMLNLRKNCFDKKFYETFYLMYVNYDLNRIEELLKSATVEIGKIPRCSNKYFNMLQQIQVIVEMQEARHIFNFSKNNIENIKWVMKTWRERMPLSHYSIENWMVLCTWRYHIYNRISNLELSEISTKGMHDLARSLNCLGKTARRNRCYDLSHNSLSKVFMLSNIEVVDAFKKIEEELKCYLCEGKYLEGLELACGANIDYFTVKEKGKIFFYKGLFTYFIERDSMGVSNGVDGYRGVNVSGIPFSTNPYNNTYNNNPYSPTNNTSNNPYSPNNNTPIVNPYSPNNNPYSPNNNTPNNNPYSPTNNTPTNNPYSPNNNPYSPNNNTPNNNAYSPNNIPFTSHSPNTLYSSSSYTNSPNTPTTNPSYSNSPNTPYPNSPNTSYFNSKSEQLFLQSLQICPDVPECWYTYGIFMEKCYYECRRMGSREEYKREEIRPDIRPDIRREIKDNKDNKEYIKDNKDY